MKDNREEKLSEESRKKHLHIMKVIETRDDGAVTWVYYTNFWKYILVLAQYFIS